jgi:hypothetical protein
MVSSASSRMSHCIFGLNIQDVSKDSGALFFREAIQEEWQLVTVKDYRTHASLSTVSTYRSADTVPCVLNRCAGYI